MTTTTERISGMPLIDIPDSESLFELAVPTIISNSVKLARVRWTKGADVASAAELPVTTLGNSFDVTGAATITSIAATSIGTVIKLHFNSALTLTHNPTSLILPGGADFVTSAGDEFEFQHYAGTNDYRVTGYVLASGKAITGGALLGDNNLWTGTNTFNKQVRFNRGVDIASAATLPNIPDGNYAFVTGTNNITAITTTGEPGTVIRHKFTGILTLTDSAALSLPGSADVITQVGDVVTWIEETAGNFIVSVYTRADGTALVSSGGVGDLLADGSVPMTADWAFGGFALTGVDQLTVTGDQTTTDTVILSSTTHTTGELLKVTGNSADTGTRSVAEIIQENASATGATALTVRQDAAQKAVVIQQNGNDIALQVNQVGDQAGIDISASAVVNANAFQIGTANALAGGRIMNLNSNSPSTTERELFRVVNNNTLATAATVAELVQDAANKIMTLDHNATAAGSSYIDFEGAAAANTTGPISTLTTSGAVTHHLQMEINGTKFWIPGSTNNPS